MILTKLVRRQLTIFAILAVIGMSAAAISYLRCSASGATR